MAVYLWARDTTYFRLFVMIDSFLFYVSLVLSYSYTINGIVYVSLFLSCLSIVKNMYKLFDFSNAMYFYSMIFLVEMNKTKSPI